MLKAVNFAFKALVTLLFFSLINTGCATGPMPDLGTYGNAVEDQLCTLEIAGGLKVTGFDGETVSWGENGTVRSEGTLSSNAWKAMQKGSEYKTIIHIPGGSHKLEANFYLWNYNSYPGVVPGSGSVSAKGLEITFVFLPGRTYFLRPVISDLNGTIEIVDYANTSGFYNNKKSYVDLTRLVRPTVKLRIEE
jgi:hypothetical protein